MADPALITSLSALIGAEYVDQSDAGRAAASTGWYPVETKQKQAHHGVPPRQVEAVVSPGTTDEVVRIVRWANETRTPLIPIGGASNTVGSTHPDPHGVAVRLGRLRNLRMEENDLLVHAGAGWNLGALEETLNRQGYTLGALPQSRHLATVGGSIAMNAVGILSGKYGRQTDLTVALEAVLPTGAVIRTSVAPGASAGPDLSRLLLGSEGTLGIITEAALRIHPLPDVRAWAAFTFADFHEGMEATRHIYRTNARAAVLCLLDSEASAEHRVTGGQATSEAVLLLAFEGDELVQTGQYQMAHAVCQKLGGVARDPEIGERWFAQRLETTWLSSNARPGGLADIVAVSATWSQARRLYDDLRAAIAPLVTQLRVQASHAYPQGVALECRFEAQAEPATPEAAIDLHRRIIGSAMDACMGAGGFIAHHYGIGLARREFLGPALGHTHLELLGRLKAALDPHNILNPGKLPSLARHSGGEMPEREP